MAMFNYQIKHKPSRANLNADYVSRYQYEQPGMSEDNGDMAISQIRATPVTLETTFLKKNVKVEATEVSVEETVLNDIVPTTTISID